MNNTTISLPSLINIINNNKPDKMGLINYSYLYIVPYKKKNACKNNGCNICESGGVGVVLFSFNNTTQQSILVQTTDTNGSIVINQSNFIQSSVLNTTMIVNGNRILSGCINDNILYLYLYGKISLTLNNLCIDDVVPFKITDDSSVNTVLQTYYQHPDNLIIIFDYTYDECKRYLNILNINFKTLPDLFYSRNLY
jgi:hypothetical protein